MKKTGLALAMMTMLCMAVFATNVSVMLVETGPGMRENGIAPEAWESGMMDVFFDNGFIASNAHNLAFDDGTIKQNNIDIMHYADSDMEDAMANGVDYFVLVLLHYNDDAMQMPPSRAVPDKIDLKLYALDAPKVEVRHVYDETYTWMNRSAPDPVYFNAQRAIRLLIPHMGGKI